MGGLRQIIIGSAGIIICAVAFLYFGVPWIYGRGVRILLKRRATEHNALVLSFDDGPGSRLTPNILDILAEYNMKATFFLLGKNILNREAIVRRIAAEGHEICSHGYNHLNYWRVYPTRAIEDIKRGWSAIDSALGASRHRYPFRPPNGKLNLFCLLYLLFHRVSISYWTIDSGDTWYKELPDFHRIAKLAKSNGGAVSLAHDFDRTDNSTDELVLKSLRAALETARENGMQVMTVGELVGRKK